MPDPTAQDEPTIEQGTAIGARSGALVGIASIIAGASAYAVLVLAARSLTPADNATFLLYWGILFACFGTMIGIQSEATRAVYTGSNRADGVRVVPMSLVLGTGAALVAFVISLIVGGGALLGIVLGVGVAAFAGHAAITGVLNGRQRWSAYALLVALESLTRLILAVIVIVAATSSHATLRGLCVVVAFASAAWMPTLLVRRDLRATLAVRADVGPRAFSNRVVLAAAAAAASTVLVVGYPVLVRLTSSDDVYATAAPLLLAVMLTRAPLMLPLSAYQGVAITHFAEHRDRGLGAVWPIFARLLVAGALFSVAWAVIGPPVLRVLGSAYDVSAGVFVLLAAGATCVALVTLSGAMCLATDEHRWFTAGWLLALVAAVAVLLAPWALTDRVVASLFVGPLVGMAVHLMAIARSARRGPARPFDPRG